MTSKEIRTQVAGHLHNAANLLQAGDEVTARDWSGFFAGIAAFLKELLPVILPLFLTTDKKPETK